MRQTSLEPVAPGHERLSRPHIAQWSSMNPLLCGHIAAAMFGAIRVGIEAYANSCDPQSKRGSEPGPCAGPLRCEMASRS